MPIPETNDFSTPVTRYLDGQNIPYRLFQHPGPISSLEQAAQERGQQPEQIIRSILFRLGKDHYAMVLIAGPRQISWQALRRHLNQSRLTMASKAEVFEVTGYEIGAVSPFGLPTNLPVLVDKDITAQGGEISIGSGQRGKTVIMHSGDMLQALGEVAVGEFAAPSKD